MGKKKTSKNNAESLKEAGNKAFLAGKFEEAITQYTAAIKLVENHIYYSNRANAYLALGQDKEAVKDCEKALEIQPKFVKALYRQGVALMNLQRLDEAKSSAVQALAIEPENELCLQLQQEVLDEIVSIEHPQHQRFQRFFDWAKSKGARFEKTRMKWYSEENRGFVAARDIKDGEQVLFVPREVMLTDADASAHPMCQELIKDEKYKNLTEDVPYTNFHCLYIMHKARNLDEDFGAYVDILPKDISEFPECFTPKEMEMLVGSQLHTQIGFNREITEQNYNYMKENLPGFSDFSIEEYRKAFYLIQSRSFRFQVNGQNTNAMVPVLDMPNHDNDYNALQNWDINQGGFELVAQRAIKRGQEINVTYGTVKRFIGFFVYYGFVNEANSEVKQFLDLTAEMPQYAEKIKVLGGLKSPQQDFDINCRDGISVISIVNWARFLYFEGPISKINSNNIQNLIELQDQQSESKVWTELISLWQIKLSAYPNTIEDDQSLLLEKNLSVNDQNIINFRLIEKTIWNNLIQLGTSIIQILSMNVKEAQRQVKVDRSLDIYDTYFKGVFNVLAGK